MSEEFCGNIYILTNPSFPDYVKIGYADNINRRLEELNRSECIPFAFRLYAYYEVKQRLTDFKIHDMIDKINPSLRSIDTFNGKPRKREFYAFTKETAYNIFESIATVSDTLDRLHLVENEINVPKEEAIAVDKIDYDMQTFLSNKSQSIIAFYNQISDEIIKQIPEIKKKTTPNYIALTNSNGKNICELHLQKQKLLIITKTPTNTSLLIGNKVPDTFLWSLNYKISVENESQIELAVAAIIDAYNQLNKD